jgi:organic radical activating enzyme
MYSQEQASQIYLCQIYKVRLKCKNNSSLLVLSIFKLQFIGEPLLQLDGDLVEKFHKFGFEVAVETNGTKLPPKEVDWIGVSPKADAELILHSGDELKLVFPPAGISPEQYEGLDFRHFFLQPMDSNDREGNTLLTVEYCKAAPRWRLSLQTHKIVGIP